MTPLDPRRPPLPPLDPSIDEPLRTGIALFNEGRFFECHDVLENVWLETHGKSRLFLQGLIQVAVGYHHLCNENRKGAESQLGRGLAKLKEYPDDYAGVALARLRGEVADWILRIQADPIDIPPIESFPKIVYIPRTP